MRAVKGGVFVAVAATVLALAALAYAGTVRQTAGSVELAPATSGVAKARCGKLKRLGKGKVSLVGTGFSGSSLGTFNQGLQPLRRKVIAGARNVGATTAKAKAFGYCTKRIPTTIRRQSSPFTPGTVHNVFVHCGKGETALAGGWKALDPQPAAWSVLNSVRQGRSTWVVSAGSSSSGTLRAYAICTTKKNLPLVARTGTNVPPAPGGISTATVKCPQGTAAMSGGFSTNVDEGTPFADMLVPVSSRRTGERTWAVGAASETASTGNHVKAHAYCLQQPVG
jgi:hypothetical protein